MILPCVFLCPCTRKWTPDSNCVMWIHLCCCIHSNALTNCLFSVSLFSFPHQPHDSGQHSCRSTLLLLLLLLSHRVQHPSTPCWCIFPTQWGPLQVQAHWCCTEQVHKDGSLAFHFDVIWPILQSALHTSSLHDRWWCSGTLQPGT